MSGMTAAVLALALTIATALAVSARRRRRRTDVGALAPLPAGVKAFANHVGSLSSLGMDLRIPAPRQGWRRLGLLLGVR